MAFCLNGIMVNSYLKPFNPSRHTQPLMSSEPIGGERDPRPLSALLPHVLHNPPLLLLLCGSERGGSEDLLPLQHLRPDRVRIRGWALPQLLT